LVSKVSLFESKLISSEIWIFLVVAFITFRMIVDVVIHSTKGIGVFAIHVPRSISLLEHSTLIINCFITFTMRINSITAASSVILLDATVFTSLVSFTFVGILSFAQSVVELAIFLRRIASKPICI
jgi:hypothetical protein